MKQTIFTLLSLFLAGTLTAQQRSLYLMYNNSCMDQLEYRYVYAGTNFVSYSIHPSNNEQYILKTGSNGITSPTLPPNTLNCREFTLNEQFLNDVNNVKRQVYIVHQQQQGYLLMPVIEATQVIRNGPYYMFRAPNYSFAIDTSNLVHESNIATSTSTWYIFFNGLKIRACYYEYSFKREPTKVGQERSEFDFIPGIGITTERTGMTAIDAENNQYRLIKMNGMALEDYITSRCQGRAATPLSKYTPELTYGAPANESDKEMASMGPYPLTPPGATNANLPPLANCPERPGEGYHIVQPGETLNSISRAYEISVKSLLSWNPIKDPDIILVCQKIWLRKPPAGATVVDHQADKQLASKSPETTGPVARRQDPYWNLNYEAMPSYYSYSPVQPSPAYTPTTTQALVHTVQQGETLYGIGQRYNLSEAEMRRLNNFPATGPVTLQPGMQLFVADCCPGGVQAPSGATPYSGWNTQPGGVSNPYTYPQTDPASQPYYQPQTNPSTQPYYQPQTNPSTQPYYQPQTNPSTQPYYQPQTNPSTQPYYQPNNYGAQPSSGVPVQPYYQPVEPEKYPWQQSGQNDPYYSPSTNPGVLPNLYNNSTTTQPGYNPNTYNPSLYGTQPAGTQPLTAKKPLYFKEYIIRQGDSINSVAVMHRVNAQELALINNKDINETLIGGQKLQIPQY